MSTIDGGHYQPRISLVRAATANGYGLAAAQTALKAQTGVSGLQEAAVFSVRRDYGQFDRAQTPGQQSSE